MPSLFFEARVFGASIMARLRWVSASRALLRDPDLLIVDEATDAVDGISLRFPELNQPGRIDAIDVARS